MLWPFMVQADATLSGPSLPYPAPPPADMMVRPAPLVALTVYFLVVFYLRIQVLYRFVCGHSVRIGVLSG